MPGGNGATSTLRTSAVGGAAPLFRVRPPSPRCGRLALWTFQVEPQILAGERLAAQCQLPSPLIEVRGRLSRSTISLDTDLRYKE